MSQNPVQKTILVVGSCSVVTQVVVKKLQTEGFHVLTWENLQKRMSLKGKNPVLSLPKTIQGTLNSIHTIISTLSISEMRSGLYDSVTDYKNNLNLLQEAKKAGVQKFIYVTFTGYCDPEHNEPEQSRKLFEDGLIHSNIPYTILRVQSIFQEWSTLLAMASFRKIIIVGDKEQRNRPIHPSAIAEAFIPFMFSSSNQEITLHGAEELTIQEIAELAFKAHNKEPRLLFLPRFSAKVVIWISNYLNNIGVCNIPIWISSSRYHLAPKKRPNIRSLSSFYSDQIQQVNRQEKRIS